MSLLEILQQRFAGIGRHHPAGACSESGTKPDASQLGRRHLISDPYATSQTIPSANAAGGTPCSAAPTGSHRAVRRARSATQDVAEKHSSRPRICRTASTQSGARYSERLAFTRWAKESWRRAGGFAWKGRGVSSATLLCECLTSRQWSRCSNDRPGWDRCR